MTFISMRFLLVSQFTAQIEVWAWTPIRFRNKPCNNLSMRFLSCFSAKKSLAENSYGKKMHPILHSCKCELAESSY